MNLWEGVPRWINTVLLVIVGFIGFHTLFLLLEANETNVIVDFVSDIATFFLAPFEGMFTQQDFLLTALIAVLGYSLAAGIALAIVRSVQATARADNRAAGWNDRRPRRGERGSRARRGERASRSATVEPGPDTRSTRRSGFGSDATPRSQEGPEPGPGRESGSGRESASGPDESDRTQRLER